MKTRFVTISSAIGVFLSAVCATTAQHAFYTSSEDFQAQIDQAESFTYGFDGIAGGNLGTNRINFSENGRAFEAAVNGAGNLWGLENANQGTHDWEGAGLSVQNNNAGILFDTLDIGNPVTAIGGRFFATQENGHFVPGQQITLTVSFNDNSTDSISITPSDFDGSFIGVTADESNPIVTFLVDSPADSNIFTSTSEVTVGVIPEPGTAALLAALLAFGLVLARRRRTVPA